MLLCNGVLEFIADTTRYYLTLVYYTLAYLFSTNSCEFIFIESDNKQHS